jgi:hypothetical protein
MAFKLDLSKFKKIATDQTHTTMRHEDGHEFKIAHSALTPKLRGQLASIPMSESERQDAKAPKKMAEGGEAAPEVPTGKADAFMPSEEQEAVIDAQSPQQPAMPSPDVAAPEATPAQAMSAPAPQPAEEKPANPLMGLKPTSGIEAQIGGEYQKAEAMRQMAISNDIALKAQAEQEQNLKDTFNQQNDALIAQQQAFQKHIMDNPVDSNHYLRSLSTGGKIMSAIGLVLGGAGAGLTGGPNQAQAMITNFINQDIDAQKANLGRVNSLLAHNLQQQGNLRAATAITRSQILDLTANQIQRAAAAQGGALAQANAQIAIGPLLQQRDMNRAFAAMLNTGRAAGNSDPQVASRIVNFFLPPEEKAAANKELETATGMINGRDNVLKSFDQVGKLNTAGKRFGSPLQSNSQINALQGSVSAVLGKELAGRFTEQDFAVMKDLFPKLTDNDKTIQMKRQHLDNIISEKMGATSYPILTSYGIDPNQWGKFNKAGESKASKIPFTPVK